MKIKLRIQKGGAPLYEGGYDIFDTAQSLQRPGQWFRRRT
jgi:hypothetical protein